MANKPLSPAEVAKLTGMPEAEAERLRQRVKSTRTGDHGALSVAHHEADESGRIRPDPQFQLPAPQSLTLGTQKQRIASGQEATP